MDLVKLGARIRDFRKQKGISQADMAAELDISITAFSKIERGITNLSISRLEDIATILNIPIVALLFDEDTNSYNTSPHNGEYLDMSLEKELTYTKELLKAKEEIIELLKNKLKV